MENCNTIAANTNTTMRPNITRQQIPSQSFALSRAASYVVTGAGRARDVDAASGLGPSNAPAH